MYARMCARAMRACVCGQVVEDVDSDRHNRRATLLGGSPGQITHSHVLITIVNFMREKGPGKV